MNSQRGVNCDGGIVAAGRVVASSVKAQVINISAQSIGKELDHQTPYRYRRTKFTNVGMFSSHS